MNPRTIVLAFAAVGLFATAFAPSASADHDLPDEDNLPDEEDLPDEDDVRALVCEETVLKHSVDCSPEFHPCEEFRLFCTCTCDPHPRFL
jgi:hypothetical protein